MRDRPKHHSEEDGDQGDQQGVVDADLTGGDRKHNQQYQYLAQSSKYLALLDTNSVAATPDDGSRELSQPQTDKQNQEAGEQARQVGRDTGEEARYDFQFEDLGRRN